MIEDLLFEIECAEKIGAFKIADSLDKKLIKIAHHKDLIKKIEKQFGLNSGIKTVEFSPSQQKLIVSAEPNISNKIKREIQQIANPMSVSFRYSAKNIDELMATTPDPLERHKKQFNPFGEYITLEEFDDAEPTAEDLEMEEIPDELSEDPNSLDAFLLEEARKQMRKHRDV